MKYPSNQAATFLLQKRSGFSQGNLCQLFIYKPTNSTFLIGRIFQEVVPKNLVNCRKDISSFKFSSKWNFKMWIVHLISCLNFFRHISLITKRAKLDKCLYRPTSIFIFIGVYQIPPLHSLCYYFIPLFLLYPTLVFTLKQLY